MATESDAPTPPPDPRAPAPELRLLDRRAYVGFPALPVAPGLTVSDFALQIPDVAFPFNVSAGASRYQRKKLLFGFLELTVDAELIQRKVAELAGRVPGIDEFKLHFRPGYLEAQARLLTPERTPLTFKLAFDGDGERLVVLLYDVRLYGFAPTPSVSVPSLIAAAIAQLGLLPEVETRGATGFSTRILAPLCQTAAVSRGFKLPELDTARLSAAEVGPSGLRLRFSAGGLPPPGPPDDELLLTLEGIRAFSEAEALLAQGRIAEARAAYMQLGDTRDAHPFAAERLLALLVADPQSHDMALDVAASLLRRREKSPAALWCEAIVRERRGENARAAERYLALCSLARRASEEASAFFSAEAAARAARDHSPHVAIKALHEVLGLKPDHLPSLKALARAADLARDRAGAIRAWRRISALARDPAEAADAHVRLARLSAQTEDDIAGARLHCEAALRLAPDLPEALLLLGELCLRSNEPLRALKALDRLREVALARHELERVGRANLLAGRVWEEGLKQPENALLRYREATSLLPGDPEPLFAAARVAEALGRLQEALDGYQQALELAGPTPTAEHIRRAAHQSHHALARLYKTKLGDPARAREHLESALALDPSDERALDELIPFFRATGRAQELAEALEKAASVYPEGPRRAALWSEAGELYRGRLQQPDKAERLLSTALEADPEHRPALESLLAMAEARRDGGLLTRCLSTLARLTAEPRERAQRYRRLAVAARDLAYDLDLAASALQEVLRLEPDDLTAIGELCALQRKRSDMPGLAAALEDRARVAEAQGDKRLAASALRERAQVLEAHLGRLGEALVALEKAARLNPDPAVLLELADLALRCERPEHARRALETLLASLPRTTAPERLADIRARLGRACELLGDNDAARAAYAQAFPLRRLDDTLAARLEVLYKEAGELRELAEMWASRAQALAATERAPEAAPLFFHSARVLLERGEKGAALLRLSAALDANPTGPLAAEVLDALAQLELERGERLEAAKLFGRKAALVPEPRASARLLYRASSLATGSSREETYLAEALERDPAFAPARIRRSELRLPNDPRSALEDLEAVLALPATDPEAPRDTELPALHRRAASAALRAGRTDSARRLLSTYCEQSPDDVDARVELAALHRQAGSHEPLADLLLTLWPRLSGEPRRAARRELAELCLELGRNDQAAEALRSLLAEEPRDTWAARSLLELLPQPGTGTPAQEEERLALLGTLILSAEGEPRAALLARRAALHHSAGRHRASRDDLLEATRLARRPAPLWLSLAELAREVGDEVDELDAWRRAVEADPALGERARERLMALARALVEKDARAPAREALQAAVSLTLSDEERCEAYFALALLARRDGQPQAEAQALAEAARQGPTARRVEALRARAALLETRGELKEAAQSLQEALALSPRDTGATTALQRVLRGLGDWARLAELLAAEAPHTLPLEGAALYAELATLYLQHLDQPESAESALRQAVRLAPTELPLRRRLVALVARRGDFSEAASILESGAGSTAPAESAALLREGVAHARTAGRLDHALELARRAHALDPARGEDLATLAELLYLKDAVAEALPLQEALAAAADLEADPEHAEATWLRLGELAEKAGEAPRAQAAYRTLLASRPLCEEAVLRLSALLEREDPRAAFEVQVAHARALAPSEDTARRLESLAQRASTALQQPELAALLLERAASMAAAPLPLHLALAALYRDTGRVPELLAELERVATLCLQAEDATAAIAALEEQARLAEDAGRVDEALRALERLSPLLERAGQPQQAAGYERHRAELLRDVKLDLSAAEEALGRSFDLAPDLWTARLGAALAERRNDPIAEARWLERALPLLSGAQRQARLMLYLARLYLDSLADPARAEQLLREALLLDRSLADAQRLLEELLEREGRVAELAAWCEEHAAAEEQPERRVELLLRAAELYHSRARQPEAAVIALLAARAARPDDLALTARAADLLHELGRAEDAAEFDALLLEADPFREPAFARHRAWLEKSEDTQALAALLLHRAQREPGPQSAESYLAAARAFHKAGALERARLCEDQAFERDPANAEAFARVRERAEGDVRRLTELLATRAAALPPQQALPLLSERARRLQDSGDSLQAAQAWEEYLALAPNEVEALAARADLAAQAAGPSASWPYDRRLLAAGGDALPEPLRLRAWMRLGHASLASGAYQDAAEAFESVVAVDAQSERGQEALSLLAEVYGKTGDTPGLYRTSLQLAERADAATAEVLYRRAADLPGAPEQALEALLPLAHLRPTDATVVDRALAGLRALGRPEEVLRLSEASARATGGARAAELLLAAAQVAEDSLEDERRAWALRQEAAEADPSNALALRALAEGLRRQGDSAWLLEVLERLVPLAEEADESSLLRLELASLARAAGRAALARECLEAVVARGPQGAGYAEALEALEALLEAEPGRRAQVQAARAELLQGRARAELLLAAAQGFEAAGRLPEALSAARLATSTEPEAQALRTLARLYQASGEPGRAAQVLLQMARLLPASERAPLLVEAAGLWEAAGERTEALEVLERLAADFPQALTPAELAERLARLGATARAAEVGFDSALAAGDLTSALVLAERAGDKARMRKALWALVQRPHVEPAHATDLADLLRAQGEGEELLRLADLLAGADAAFAEDLRMEVLGAAACPLALRLRALEALVAQPGWPQRLEPALPGLGSAPEELVEALLRRARALRGGERAEALSRLAEAWPERRQALLRERLALERHSGAEAAAADTLVLLAEAEREASSRAALYVERAELLLGLGEPEQARTAFEQALREDAGSQAALKRLLDVYAAAGEHAACVSTAERLSLLAGPQALEPWREVLALALEALGRLAEAAEQLALLPETPERLQHRLRLAQARGLTGEALQLRERLTQEPAELQSILRGYLEAQLMGFAVRLAESLFRNGQLLGDTARLVAERLAPTQQGASLAVLVWPQLLRQEPMDADGWTLYAEALRRLGLVAEAERADGFGAALVSSTASAPAVVACAPPRPEGFRHPLPQGVEALSAERMPRLYAVLGPVLEALGAAQLQVLLHPAGGVEAWLASPEQLVLGTGALACFGPAELGYLCALALCLGAAGEALSRPGPVPGLEQAAVAAWHALPASLAAGRVLALLAPAVRGSDPSRVEVGRQLRSNPAFRAVALAALEHT